MLKTDIKKYSRKQLDEFKVNELIKICAEQRIIIVNGNVRNLKKEEIIDKILRFRNSDRKFIINSYREKGVENVSRIVKDMEYISDEDSKKITLASKSIYPEFGIIKEDEFKLEVRIDGSANNIEECNVLMIDSNRTLYGIFSLHKEPNRQSSYYLMPECYSPDLNKENTENKEYIFLFLKKEYSEYIFKVYYSKKEFPALNLKYEKVMDTGIKIKWLEKTDEVLAIDLGISSTTAAAFLGESYIEHKSDNAKVMLDRINYVEFTNFDLGERIEELVPTIAYVLDCSDSQNVRYCFGYDAKTKIKSNGYSYDKASVFYDIKRLIYSFREEKEIFDEKGNVARVKKGDIVRAYIQYVVRTAERQFKCKFKSIHILTSIKQDTISVFKELMPGYDIGKYELTDEGTAVLYDSIAEMMDRVSYEDREYKALVIKCGGRTTDLYYSSFRIESVNDILKLDLKTAYRNGCPNFGGDNITYRIMQYIKIVLARYFRNPKDYIDINSIISVPDNDIFRYVDNCEAKKTHNYIYEDLKERYEDEEEIIPTRFKKYKNKTGDEYRKVKNNFYVLWEAAESMKIDFYKGNGVLMNKFASSRGETQEKYLNLTLVNDWKLYVMERTSW